MVAESNREDCGGSLARLSVDGEGDGNEDVVSKDCRCLEKGVVGSEAQAIGSYWS